MESKDNTKANITSQTVIFEIPIDIDAILFMSKTV